MLNIYLYKEGIPNGLCCFLFRVKRWVYIQLFVVSSLISLYSFVAASWLAQPDIYVVCVYRNYFQNIQNLYKMLNCKGSRNTWQWSVTYDKLIFENLYPDFDNFSKERVKLTSWMVVIFCIGFFVELIIIYYF